MAEPPVDRARQRRGRIILVLFMLVCGGVVATSLITNLNRLGATSSAPVAEAKGPVETQGKTEPLDILSADKRHAFRVEVMRTNEDRGRGLMFRRSMPADHGMLFDFERDQIVLMWMKNTYLPLDMLFVLADGRIHRIEANTEPESEKTISSGVAVRAVLELNAGSAARLGLKPGDRLVHPMFR